VRENPKLDEDHPLPFVGGFQCAPPFFGLPERINAYFKKVYYFKTALSTERKKDNIRLI